MRLNYLNTSKISSNFFRITFFICTIFVSEGIYGQPCITTGQITFTVIQNSQCPGSPVRIDDNAVYGSCAGPIQYTVNGTYVNNISLVYPTATTTYCAYQQCNQGGCWGTSASGCVTVNVFQHSTITPLPSFVDINSPSITLSGSPPGGTFVGTNFSAGIIGNEFYPSNAGLGNYQIKYVLPCPNQNIFDSTSTIVYDTTGTYTTYDTIITHTSGYDSLVINLLNTGIPPPNNTNTITVYNTTNDMLYINNGNLNAMAGYQIIITDTLGQEWFNESVWLQILPVDTSLWLPGTYILTVVDINQNIKATKYIIKY